jgi:hypothetical protein
MEVDVPPVSDPTAGHGSADAPLSVIDVDEEMLDGTAPHEETIKEDHKVPQATSKVKDTQKFVSLFQYSHA